MELLPWRSERPLDALGVVRVVTAQFPDLVPVRASYLAEGWDSETYEVNGEWIFRFPKRADVQGPQAIERRLLPRLAPTLPLPIPDLTRFGEPGAEFPFRFLGYRKLRGLSAADVSSSAVDLDACGTQLGAFLGALHTYPADDARRVGVREDAEMHFVALRNHFREHMADVAPALGPDLTDQVDDMLKRAGPPAFVGPRCLVHYDLGDEHILLAEDGSRVAGILDWGDVGIGDPATDFAGLWQWLGRPLVDLALRAYGLSTDSGLLERASLGAVFGSLSSVWYSARADRPSHLASGLRGLANSLGKG